MSDPTPSPLHNALDWARKQADSLVHALSSIRLSAAAAEVAPVVEAVLEAALPPALAAGEKALADVLTPEHLAGIARLIGDVNAALAAQYLARVPVPEAPK